MTLVNPCNLEILQFKVAQPPKEDVEQTVTLKVMGLCHFLNPPSSVVWIPLL